MKKYIISLNEQIKSDMNEEAKTMTFGEMARFIAKNKSVDNPMEIAKKSRSKVNSAGNGVYAYNDTNLTIVFDEKFNSVFVYSVGLDSKKEKVMSVFKGVMDFKTKNDSLFNTAKQYIQKLYDGMN